MNPTYHTYAQDIIGPQNLYLGLQNTPLLLIYGPSVVSWLSFFLDRLVYACIHKDIKEVKYCLVFVEWPWHVLMLTSSCAATVSWGEWS